MRNLPRHRTVADVMTSRVHIAGPQTPFKLIVRLIDENRVSAIPIVDQGGIPIGVVSEADLLLKESHAELDEAPGLLHLRKRREQRSKAAGTVAADVMSSPPITIDREATIAEAARIMQGRNVRRLVVVDSSGRIAGIVSRSDLLQVFLRGDRELHAEIVNELIPALFLESPLDVRVNVRWNVVTLSGELDRKSDAEMLGRMAGDLDGVVSVVNRLTSRLDDSEALPYSPVSLGRRFKAI
jgi:CBS domain-containing protein